CVRCGKTGHSLIDCQSTVEDAAIVMGVAEDVVDDDSVCPDADAEAFTSLDMTVDEINVDEYVFATVKGDVEQSDGGEPWVLDTGATSHFSPASSKMTDYRKCSGRVLRCAGGGTYPIVGRRNLALYLRSYGRDMVLHVKNANHAPCVRHHLFSLTAMSNAGHTYIGSSNGFRVELKSGNTLKIPRQHRQLIMYVHRISPNGHDKHASECAVIAPGKLPNPQVEDINEIHSKHAHVHEDLLRRTAKQLGVELRGELRPCRGCSEGKGLRQPILRSTHTRAVEPASRVFVDLTGPKPVRSRWGKSYMMIVRDDCSRHTRLFPLRTKDEYVQYFSKYIAEIHPRKVEKVRRDGGGEFSEGAFEELCDREKIKQEKITADSPQSNGVAERAIDFIESAGLAAKIQASEIYPNQNIPTSKNLWAEQANWACHALNCTATSANPGNKTPHGMWHGVPPENKPL
ncbi:unnamed protein product, partial [Sphacelaria rigidula]